MRKFSKRTAAVSLGALVVTGAGVAFASTMTVDSKTLGGGSSAVGNGCNVTVSYPTADLTYSPSAGGYVISSVQVTPSDTSACAGKTWKVTVSDGTHTGEATDTFANGTAVAETDSLTNSLNASDVGNVYAAVTG